MNRTQHNRAFTIVELLTVMAVIALLIGLLVPALSMVRDRATDLQQRAQFHAITSGLEMFKADFGDYPESKDNSIPPDHPDDNSTYTGANKLAEAMVGLDYLGFHPNSGLRSDGRNTITDKTGATRTDLLVYHANTDIVDWETRAENIQARKGPYVELENANAFRMDEVYNTTIFPGMGFTDAFDTTDINGNPITAYPLVLADVYAKKRSGVNSRKTGTPILYFKARTFRSIQDSRLATVADFENSIYDFRDNVNILDLGMPDTGLDHFITGDEGDVDNLTNFDDIILNKTVTSVRRPYRAGSFILWSAGKDGMFGTGDDIFNFTRADE